MQICRILLQNFVSKGQKWPKRPFYQKPKNLLKMRKALHFWAILAKIGQMVAFDQKIKSPKNRPENGLNEETVYF